MLPGASSKRRSGRSGLRGLRASALFLAAAAILFLASAAILYAIAPEESTRQLRSTARMASTHLTSTVKAAQTTVKAAQTAAAAATAATGVAVAKAASGTKQAVASSASSVSSHFERLARRGKEARARANAECKDLVATCVSWAEKGECTANPGYMRPNCPKSCDACLDAAKKAQLCHRTREREPLVRRGGVDATFTRLVSLLSPEYGVAVHSRPPHGPWVVTIDDFLAEHEIRALMQKGGHHFERSLAGDGVSPVRTSKTSWCNVPFCESDPTIRSIKLRVQNATGVPLANSEHVQVLQYDPGDFYRQHHDQNAHPHSPWGPRLFTFFLYLNNVAEGVRTQPRLQHPAH